METIVDEVLVSYQTINPGKVKKCLVLHGWGHKGELWRNLVERLDKKYSYILLDLPGFGGSVFLKKKGADVDDYSRFIKRFMKKIGIRKALLLGHSFGGQIATDIAIRDKKLVEGLILMAPAVVRKKTLKQKIKVVGFSKFNFLKKITPPSLLDKFYRWVSTSDYYNASDEHKKILKKITNYDLSNELEKIDCPVLVVWGEKDEAIPIEGKFMAEKIKKAQFRIIYGAGHNMYLERPEELSIMVNKFLTNGITFN